MNEVLFSFASLLESDGVCKIVVIYFLPKMSKITGVFILTLVPVLNPSVYNRITLSVIYLRVSVKKTLIFRR